MAQYKQKYAVSRNTKRLIVFLLILCALTISLCDRYFGISARHEISHFGSSYDDYLKYHEKSFKVINIVDGDTIDIDIADGETEYTRVRMLGIDTPEKAREGEPSMHFADEATEFTSGKVLGKEVTILIDEVGDVRGKYGRVLGYIRLGNNTILNEDIVREGFGYADMRFMHSRLQEYLQLQNEAKSNRKGLWKEAGQEDLPAWLIRLNKDILQQQKVE